MPKSDISQNPLPSGKNSNASDQSGILTRIQSKVSVRIIPAIICIIIFCGIYFAPKPDGLTLDAWHFVAIFVAILLGIILKAMPIGVMSIIAITVVALSQTTAPTSAKAVASALSNYNSPLIWLVIISIMVSRGLIKTGLGARLGYYFIALLGRHTLGIGYGLALCELLLAPFTPSNTARAGGIIHPIMRSIALAFDSDPSKGTQGKVGAYLALVNYHANPITSGMFITATAPNPLVVNYIAQATGNNFHLTWSAWALYMLVPGLIAMILMPLVIFLISPPEMKRTPDAVTFAKNELKNLGRLKGSEIIMLLVFLLMLLLWAGLPAAVWGPAFIFDPTLVALIGITILLLCGTLTWQDILAEKGAWNTLIWFGALIMLAGQLDKLGVVFWFSDNLRSGIETSGMGWPFAMAILILIFLYSHYVFASTTAHISAMMLAFMTVGVHLIPPQYVNYFMMMMLASSTIMMGLTHYATGPSPIIFGSGYVTLARWWGVGFVMSVVNLLIFAIIGGIWWKVLGVW